MVCTPIKLPNGMHAIICSSRGRKVKRCDCGRVGTLLCDWKVGAGKTCDAPICEQHAEQVAEDKHLCPKHSKEWAERRALRIVP